MERNPNSPSGIKSFRYTLATLAFLILCVAGYLAGYRKGFDTSREDRRLATRTTESYRVGKLVNPLPGCGIAAPDYETLIHLITTTVQPGEWNDIQREIVPFPQADSIVVTQTGAMHDKVRDLLDRMLTLRAHFDQRVRSGVCGQCGGSTTSHIPPRCQNCGFSNPVRLD